MKATIESTDKVVQLGVPCRDETSCVPAPPAQERAEMDRAHFREPPFTRIVEFTPAFDRRDANPRKDYGIHGVELRMILKGPEGATSFTLYTQWQLPHVRQELDERVLRMAARLDQTELNITYHPLPADLGYHSPKPMYEGQMPIGSQNCSFENGEDLELSPDSPKIRVPKITQTGTFTPCPYVNGGPCYYDGSSLNARPVYERLVREGDGVWQALEEYYAETFLKVASIEPQE